MKRNGIREITFGGMTAALYIILTCLSGSLGLASGPVQIRLSEALCLLPCLTGAAIPGLSVGCLLANLITGCAATDVVFGTLATAMGAAGTHLMRKRTKLSWIPPVLSNTLIIPFVLRNVYGITAAWPLAALGVFIGEMIGCCGLGLLLLPFETRIISQF